MQSSLSSRFSDSTIGSCSSHASYSTSASSIENLLLPAFNELPKLPPRTSSIAPKKRKASAVSHREKPVPLTIKPYSPYRAAPLVVQEDYFNHKDPVIQEDYFNHKFLQQVASQPAKPATTCFCGTTVSCDNHAHTSASASIGIYCSRRCARQDALNALEGSSPCTTDFAGDDNLPVTPNNFESSNAYHGSQSKYTFHRDSHGTKRIASVESSHYRRMEALGLYDNSPTKHNNKVALAPLGADAADSYRDSSPRKSLFFPVPVYLCSPP